MSAQKDAGVAYGKRRSPEVLPSGEVGVRNISRFQVPLDFRSQAVEADPENFCVVADRVVFSPAAGPEYGCRVVPFQRALHVLGWDLPDSIWDATSGRCLPHAIDLVGRDSQPPKLSQVVRVRRIRNLHPQLSGGEMVPRQSPAGLDCHRCQLDQLMNIRRPDLDPRPFAA